MDNPVISIIVLSWNRELLLRNTILSLLVTTKSKFEIFIVDNASTDGSKEWLQVFSNFYPSIKVFFLDENIGGEAFNIPLSKVKGKYVLFSENDLEYLPGWDEYMIHQFESFSELGQLSPFAPNPMREIGEVWVDKPFEVEKKGNEVLFKAIHNVTTTCMVRTELLEKGLKWTNLISKEGLFKFPADGKFSADVKNMGYLVGWSDQYKSINWGFNQRIISKEKEYYNENWKEKSNLNIDGIDLDSKKEDLNSFQQKLVNLQIENFDLRQKVFTLEGQLIQLYLDLGEGFSESDSLKVPIEQAKLRYEISLDITKEYKQFRVDISNNPVKVIIKKVFLMDVNNKEYPLEIKESGNKKSTKDTSPEK
jgi:glycosyltransferase involved in cell wall biosynthesis